MIFAFPYAAILPVLYIITRLLRRRSPERSISFPSGHFLRSLPVSTRLRLRKPTLFILEAIVLCALSIAAARPQRVTLIEQSNLARNIMLVIDASNSMSAEDFPSRFGTTSRMQGVKTVVGEYVRSRSGDRVGLIVFGNTSYLQSPLTSDMALVEGLVEIMQPRMAGDGTAIGDGLGLALKRLRDVEASSKAIILITDGVNTAGQVSPLKAAQIARGLGVQVHTIGIGSGQAPLGGQGISGLLAGQAAQMADFDEATLKEVARTTGGVYFNATSLEGFKEVYRQIDKLSETEQRQPQKPLVDELFAPFAMAGLLALLLSITLNSTYFRKAP